MLYLLAFTSNFFFFLILCSWFLDSIKVFSPFVLVQMISCTVILAVCVLYLDLVWTTTKTLRYKACVLFMVFPTSSSFITWMHRLQLFWWLRRVEFPIYSFIAILGYWPPKAMNKWANVCITIWIGLICL